MNALDTQTGSTRLYHPRGPCVNLPVPSDPAEAFAHIGRCIDAGWLPNAPGLELSEQKEEVGFILRGAHDGNGQTTPYLLLYSSNPQLSFSFLKVYLDRAQDIAAFEHAAGMKLDDLPEYAGSDKPERGKSPKLDRFIVPARRPFSVILKPNPRHKEADRQAAIARGEIYKTPARIFVRWADQAPAKSAAQSPTPTNGKPPASAPAPKPQPAKPTPSPPRPAARQPTQEEAHALILERFRTAKVQGDCDDIAAWGKRNYDFTPIQEDVQGDAYHKAMVRLGIEEETPGGEDDDIPF